MLYGIIDSEALHNPQILNSIIPIKVIIEHHPDSITSPFWHCYLLRIEEGKTSKLIEELSLGMKEGWFGIFWNESIVKIIFSNKIFTLKMEEKSTTSKYLKVKKYGIIHGVQEKYLDFKNEILKFNKYTAL